MAKDLLNEKKGCGCGSGGGDGHGSEIVVEVGGACSLLPAYLLACLPACLSARGAGGAGGAGGAHGDGECLCAHHSSSFL